MSRLEAETHVRLPGRWLVARVGYILLSYHGDPQFEYVCALQSPRILSIT